MSTDGRKLSKIQTALGFFFWLHYFPVVTYWGNSMTVFIYIKCNHMFGLPWCMHGKSLQLCLGLCDPMNCSPLGSSVYGIFQGKILEWVPMPFSRASSWHRDWTRVSRGSCITSRFFTTQLPGGSAVKNLPAMQETQVQSLSQEDPMEKEMATHSSILAWEIPWTEESGKPQSMGSQESDTT